MKKYFIGLSFSVLLLSTLPVFADGPLGHGSDEKSKKVLDVLGDSSLNADVKKERLRTFYGQMFDEVEFSRRTLGANWPKLNPAQQQEFVRLFAGYWKRLTSINSFRIPMRNRLRRETTLASNQASSNESHHLLARNPHRLSGDPEGRNVKVYDVIVENVRVRTIAASSIPPGPKIRRTSCSRFYAEGEGK